MLVHDVEIIASGAFEKSRPLPSPGTIDGAKFEGAYPSGPASPASASGAAMLSLAVLSRIPLSLIGASGVPVSGAEASGASTPASELVSKHAFDSHDWPGRQAAVVWHALRHWLSGAQVRPVGHGLAPAVPQVSSDGSVQTSYMPAATQRSPGGQSRVSAHASWQCEKTHTNGASQSLLMVHVAASAEGPVGALLQLTAGTATTRPTGSASR